MADLRPQFSEEAVGANHPTKADVMSRAWNVEHEEDGTHNNVTQGDGKSVTTDKVKARDGDGLFLEDDGGNGIEVVDGGIVHIAKQSILIAYMSANQDIPDTAITIVEFDTEVADRQNEFNTTTFTFTAATAGIYNVSVALVYNEAMSDTKIARIYIYKNGAEYTRATSSLGVTDAPAISLSIAVSLAATNTIDIRTYQNNTNARMLETTSRLSITKIA